MKKFSWDKMLFLLLSFYLNYCFGFPRRPTSTQTQYLKLSEGENTPIEQQTLLERTRQRMLEKSTTMTEIQDDFPKRFKVKDFDEDEKERKQKDRENKQSANAKMSEARAATFGSFSIEELKSRMKETERPKKLELKQNLEDLNGIKPERPLQFSIVAALMATAGWQVTVYMTEHFGVGFLDSDLYPVQRLAIVVRNIVIGILTLGTTFSAAISVGLVLLGVRVASGVASGELDPNKVVEETVLPTYKEGGAIRTTGDMLRQIFDSNEKKK